MRKYSNDEISSILNLGNGSYQIAFDKKEEENGYSAQYVNTTDISEGGIIRALMRDKYPHIDDEIAIINNKDVKPEQYNEYMAYREWAKETAKNILLC